MSDAAVHELSAVDWALRPLHRFADFHGRAPRAEYWWFVVGVGVTGFLLGLADALILHMRVLGNYGPLGLFFELMVIIPSVAVLVRRLHDIDRTGWWALLKVPSLCIVLSGTNPFHAAMFFRFLPNPVSAILILAYAIIGLTLLIFVVTHGTFGSNRYGPDPYGAGELEEVFA